MAPRTGRRSRPRARGASGARGFSRAIFAARFTKTTTPPGQWSDERDGKPAKNATKKLSQALKKFGIETNKTIRLGDDTRRGFKWEAFEDPRLRYLPSSHIHQQQEKHQQQPFIRAESEHPLPATQEQHKSNDQQQDGDFSLADDDDENFYDEDEEVRKMFIDLGTETVGKLAGEDLF